MNGHDIGIEKKAPLAGGWEAALAVEDLSENPRHAVGMVLQRVASGLEKRGWPAPGIVRGPRVVTPDENYGLLGYPASGASAEAGRTRWLPDGRMLRTQTSAMAPGWLVENSGRRGVCGILAGITHRRDVRDRIHCPDPHQADVWVLERGMGPRDMERLARDVVDSACPGAGSSLVLSSSPHSYTEGGLEGTVPWEGGWLEVLECGLIAKSLVGRLGLPGSTGGLALGMGLDRLAMLAKGLPDIRLLRSGDPRVGAQMGNLSKWRPVSNRPAARRDVSVVVGPGATCEDVSEAVAGGLGEEGLGDLLEGVSIEGSWTEDELPADVARRLRMPPGGRNLLVRMVLRRMDGTVSGEEAARAAGVAGEWLSRLV